jgi:glycosyltransferase involved in cell wall biosynthesis
MRVLLSYSAEHFDPDLPMEEQIHWGTSANVISRTIYSALSRRGDVTFIDAAQPDLAPRGPFDLFVGIQRNFGAILERSSPDAGILAAVNMHPAEHNELLLDFVVRERLPSSALHALDVHDVDERARALEAADSILLFGNGRTLASYTRHGIASEKIRLLSYGVDLRNGSASNGSSGRGREVRILYSASEIGLRKGFDIVASLAEDVDLEGLGAHLHIAGAATYPHYRAKLAELEERLAPRLTNHGWLEPSGEEYRRLLESSDYLLFPSLEEGQAGSVLDAMACGVIPLVSPNSGLDFSPLGFCELETGSARNRDLLRRACALPESERARLRRETLEHYDEFHAGFEARLDEALDELLGGSSAGVGSPGGFAAVAGGASPGRQALSLRQRVRRRYLVVRARWLSSWRLHRTLGAMRRRLPI